MLERLFERLKSEFQKSVEGLQNKQKVKAIETWRFCPFCGTSNKPDNKKCRKCKNILPEPAKQFSSQKVREYDIAIEDPRSALTGSFEKLIILLPLIIGAIYYLSKYIGKSDFEHLGSLLNFLPALVAFLPALLKKLFKPIKRICQSCGQTIMIREINTKYHKCWI